MQEILKKYKVKELTKTDLMTLSVVCSTYIKQPHSGTNIELSHRYALLQVIKKLYNRQFTAKDKTSLSLNIVEVEALTTAMAAYETTNNYTFALIVRLMEDLNKQL